MLLAPLVAALPTAPNDNHGTPVLLLYSDERHQEGISALWTRDAFRSHGCAESYEHPNPSTMRQGNQSQLRFVCSSLGVVLAPALERACSVDTQSACSGDARARQYRADVDVFNLQRGGLRESMRKLDESVRVVIRL